MNELVAPSFQADVAEGRLAIHHADCLTKVWPRASHWSIAWHGMRPNAGESVIPEMERLLEVFAARADWQGASCYVRLRAQRAMRLQAPPTGPATSSGRAPEHA